MLRKFITEELVKRQEEWGVFSTMSLEEAIAYIDNDELVEVTPKAIRLRKIHLDPHERKRAARSA